MGAVKKGRLAYKNGYFAYDKEKDSIMQGKYTHPKSGPSIQNPMNHEPKLSMQKLPDKGLKYDAGKHELSLYPLEALEAIVRVLEFGAKKYGRDNWRNGITTYRLVDAALRHIFAYASGEKYDNESGLSHLAHAGCCIAFLLTYESTEDMKNGVH